MEMPPDPPPPERLDEPPDEPPLLPPAPDGRNAPAVRLVVTNDLRRSRLTVLLRFLLAIPHLVWISLWLLAILVLAVAAWLAVSVTGRLPAWLAPVFSAFVRYQAQLGAYLSLAANPFPGFLGDRAYPVDVEIDPPARQTRWTALLRLLLAYPALVLASQLGGAAGLSASSYGLSGGAVILAVAFLGWFACLALGRMPAGLRDLAAYTIGYSAQVTGYVLFLTGGYPCADPSLVLPGRSVPFHPVRIGPGDDVRRSRLLVLFRLPLTVPHVVWLGLWGIVAALVLPVAWLLTLALGRLPTPLHRFLAAYTRTEAQVLAFLTLVGGPFPGFTGGPYPVDLQVDDPAGQSRLRTLARPLLAVPAVFLATTLAWALGWVAVMAWFHALVTGRAPSGVQRLGVAAIRYLAQLGAYVRLLTDRYPHSSPALDSAPDRAAAQPA